MIRLSILTAAFVGGFAIMTLEMLGGRMLAPWFGSSIHVWGSLITVFMLALSVGYLLGGRWSLHNPSLARYSVLFLLASLLILPLIPGADPVMKAIFIHFDDPRYGALLACIALFFIVTIALGMIGPYSIRLLVEEAHHSGHHAGLLFFVSTAGSALGALMTSFYLVLWMDINSILYMLSGLLMTCAALLRYLHR